MVAKTGKKNLTMEDEHKLVLAWQKDKNLDARNNLILHYRVLCRNMVMRFSKDPEHRKDLMNEAFIGLIEAADRFDVSRGSRFSTYAKWHVLDAISSSVQSIHHMLGPSRRILARSQTATDDHHGSVRQSVVLSLETQIDQNADEESVSISDTITDPGMTPEEEMISKERVLFASAMIKSGVLQVLNDREKDIFTRRNLSDPPETLDYIANFYSISRERVRQLESSAWDRLQKWAANLKRNPALMKKELDCARHNIIPQEQISKGRTQKRPGPSPTAARRQTGSSSPEGHSLSERTSGSEPSFPAKSLVLPANDQGSAGRRRRRNVVRHQAQ